MSGGRAVGGVGEAIVDWLVLWRGLGGEEGELGCVVVLHAKIWGSVARLPYDRHDSDLGKRCKGLACDAIFGAHLVFFVFQRWSGSYMISDIIL